MKKFLLEKNVKFAMLFTIASIAGIQTGEAGIINCPAGDSITAEMTHQKGNWNYSGVTTGAQEIVVSKAGSRAKPNVMTTRPFRPQFGVFGCAYGEGHSLEDDLLLLPAPPLRSYSQCHVVDAHGQHVGKHEYGDRIECP